MFVGGGSFVYLHMLALQVDVMCICWVLSALGDVGNSSCNGISWGRKTLINL